MIVFRHDKTEQILGEEEMSIFEHEKRRPDSQLYFYAAVCQATEPQIGNIKKMLAAQNVKVIFQMVDLGYLWIQRGRPEVKP